MSSFTLYPLPFTLVVLCSGCALFQGRLPEPLAPPQVARILQDRSDRCRSFQAKLSLHITQEIDGEEESLPSMGGIIAFDAARPGLWLRATKFTQEVFTLKALGSQFALRFPSSHEFVVGGPPAWRKLPQLVRPAEVRSIFAGPAVLGITWPDTTMKLEGGDYVFEARVLGVLYRRVRVDRRRVVVVAIERYDTLGRLELNVLLDRYGDVAGTPAPHRLIVRRPRLGFTVEMRLDGMKIKPISEVAFKMKRPHGWRLINLDVQPVTAIRALGGR
jgi:hypothetical protein